MRIAMRQIQEQERLEKATCVSCGREFWATEAYTANVRAGKTESLCRQCDDPEPLLSEDDNSLPFTEEHPDRTPEEMGADC